MEPFKNFFNEALVQDIAERITQEHSSFDTDKLNSLVFTKKWELRELKDRLHHITHCLKDTLPDYPKAAQILIDVSSKIKENKFGYLVFPTFIENFGIDHWDISMIALKEVTRTSTSEGAVRPFIIKDSKKMMAIMTQWANDDNHHVRRLASEGCRPRLPWMMALPEFKKDPSPIMPILDILKNDPEDYVRRSVANNLNDISKDHPEIVLKIAQKWSGKTKHTDWIVKHALRTLLKKGNTDAMQLFGFGNPKDIEINNLIHSKKDKKLSIGDSLEFSFQLELKTNAKVRLEYIVDYIKSNSKPSPKVFYISEKDLKKGTHIISKKHSFKDVSIRKHYPGTHQITVVVNGVQKKSISFQLS